MAHSHPHDHGSVKHSHDHNHGQSGDDDRQLEEQNKRVWDERAKEYEFPASTYMTEVSLLDQLAHVPQGS
jgi:hypothetical protein